MEKETQKKAKKKCCSGTFGCWMHEKFTTYCCIPWLRILTYKSLDNVFRNLINIFIVGILIMNLWI